MRHGLVALMCLLLFTACGRSGEGVFHPQQWQDLEVTVEPRPAPPRPGMNEFLVIVSKRGIRPREDLVVSLRLAPDEPWHQAIQDGDTGVFRKALRVRAGDRALQVRIRRSEKGEVGVLVFPFPGTGGAR
ncbi:MAG TPA: hypothetical protein ENK48_05770 [Gammaproteobacteria bacterium]|nr:hypothetical protein [Gammaproteobacteria bacterium]